MNKWSVLVRVCVRMCLRVRVQVRVRQCVFAFVTARMCRRV